MKRHTWRHEHDIAEAADLERGGVLSPFSMRCDEILRGMLRNMRREKIPLGDDYPRPHGVLQAEAARAHAAFNAVRGAGAQGTKELSRPYPESETPIAPVPRALMVSATSGLSVKSVQLMERLVASLRGQQPDEPGNAPLRFVGGNAFAHAVNYVQAEGIEQAVEIERGGIVETWVVFPNRDAVRLVPK